MTNLKSSCFKGTPSEEAQGAHYVAKQSVSVSRLCCGSVSLVVKKGQARLRMEIDKEAWADLVENLKDV